MVPDTLPVIKKQLLFSFVVDTPDTSIKLFFMGGLNGVIPLIPLYFKRIPVSRRNRFNQVGYSQRE
jgi:hypothetical protein